ncbi:MAG: hydroxyacid dehydrogenase [Lentisphaerae bacterium]|nr:hydroxyacid dehydrogenase [Lentisphaerota bacterium]MCP4100402.1 hydroxyacid dehydrogenase [Lentisphaerota bacterium]
MKVLIADKLSDKAIAELKKMGAEITFEPSLGAEDLPQHVSDTEILIVRSTKVKAETIKAAPMLSLIIRAGAGVNTIDLEAAGERAIHVANCPGKNTDAVAELAIGLMIAADRRIVDASCDLRSGYWRKKEYGKARGLKGRTLGIIGLGSIGKAVCDRAKGLQMNVVAWSRSLTDDKAKAMGISRAEFPLTVAETSDVVCLHLAANAETKHMINDEFLSRMKDGAILVNAARGEVVDTEAIKKAVKEKGLRYAADVFENEPTGGEADFHDKDLASLITATPHIGASTDQAAEAIADEVVRIIDSYKKTGKPENVVNVCAKSKAITSLVVRHYNRVGVLAAVLDKLKNAGINVEEMENTIFEGGAAASCALQLDEAPVEDVIKSIGEDENIISAMVK